jgi:hypothetical protein
MLLIKKSQIDINSGLSNEEIKELSVSLAGILYKPLIKFQNDYNEYKVDFKILMSRYTEIVNKLLYDFFKLHGFNTDIHVLEDFSVELCEFYNPSFEWILGKVINFITFSLKTNKIFKISMSLKNYEDLAISLSGILYPLLKEHQLFYEKQGENAESWTSKRNAYFIPEAKKRINKFFNDNGVYDLKDNLIYKYVFGFLDGCNGNKFNEILVFSRKTIIDINLLENI